MRLESFSWCHVTVSVTHIWAIYVKLFLNNLKIQIQIFKIINSGDALRSAALFPVDEQHRGGSRMSFVERWSPSTELRKQQLHVLYEGGGGQVGPTFR